MRNTVLAKCILAILLLLNATTFSSCMIDVDTSTNSKTSFVNPLAGVYKMRGSMYNYSGTVVYSPPPAVGLSIIDSLSVPPGYVSRIDLSPFSPKTATVIDSLSVSFPYANFVTPDHIYYMKAIDPAAYTITFDFSPAMYSKYSHVERFVRHYTMPSLTGKSSWRFITHYNDKLAGAGDDHIVDEVFEQL